MENTPNADEGQGTGNTNASRDANADAERNKGGRPRNTCGQGWSGNALKLRRMARGLSATGFGRIVGVSQSTILRWERGDSPTGVQLRRVAAALECEPGSLAREPEII